MSRRLFPRNKFSQIAQDASRRIRIKNEREEAEAQASDPEKLVALFDAFKQNPDQQLVMFGNAVTEAYTANPVYLNKEVLPQLTRMAPDIAVAYATKEHEFAKGAGFNLVQEKLEGIVLQAMEADAALVTHKNVQLAFALSGYRQLPPVTAEESLWEKFCRTHPEMLQPFNGLKDVDFEQRQKERAALTGPRNNP